MHDIWNCALLLGCSSNSLMSSQSEVPPSAGRWKGAGWTLMNVNEVWATSLLWRSPCSVLRLLDCRLEGLPWLPWTLSLWMGLCYHKGCSGPLCVQKHVFLPIDSSTDSWAGTISMCVFPSHSARIIILSQHCNCFCSLWFMEAKNSFERMSQKKLSSRGLYFMPSPLFIFVLYCTSWLPVLWPSREYSVNLRNEPRSWFTFRNQPDSVNQEECDTVIIFQDLWYYHKYNMIYSWLVPNTWCCL